MGSDLTSLSKKATLPKKGKEKSFTILAIGASAGGLQVMSTVLKNLPHNTGNAHNYVQHLSPDHKSLFTSILSKITKLKVQEIEDMDHMAPNNIYVIPSNKVIEATNEHIQFHPYQKKNIPLTIDFGFSSLAETFKENLIGLVDFVLSPEEITTELFRLGKSVVLKRDIKEKGTDKELNIENNNYNPNTISQLLLKETNRLAIIINELPNNIANKILVQIFVTDFSEKLIHDARIGEYSQSNVRNYSRKKNWEYKRSLN